jgi:hypothetical protein
MSTRVSALKTRFTPPITPTAARRNGWRHTQSRPSVISAFNRVGCRTRGCCNGRRMNSSAAKETR